MKMGTLFLGTKDGGEFKVDNIDNEQASFWLHAVANKYVDESDDKTELNPVLDDFVMVVDQNEIVIMWWKPYP